MKILAELKRRNVLRTIVLYLVTSWLIMQVVDVVSDLAKLPDWLGQTTLGLLVVGLPLAVVISWFYVIAPVGINLEKETDSSTSRSHTTGRRHEVVIISILAAAVILFAADKWWVGKVSEKSIAVLPFVSLTADPVDEVFADGLTEGLSHVLARLGDLKVAGRTSSFYFKGRDEDVREIGNALGVAHVLQGSVRRSGNVLRVTAQLISTEDGFNLWSESYDREMRDIIQIQKDIARSVAGRLNSEPSGDRVLTELSESTISPEAYALYLAAVSRSPYGRGNGLGEAQALAEQVTELAPDFAPGWNRLAAIHGRRLIYRDQEYPHTPEEAAQIIYGAIEKALSIDPESGEAYANQAGMAWVVERNTLKAAPLVERSLELDPWNLDLVSFAADFAKHIGRLDDALELEEVLVARDPLCEICRANLARSYVLARRYDEAETQYRTMQSMSGGFHWSVGVVLLMLQEPEQALDSFRQLNSFEYLRLQGEAMALHSLGRFEESEAALAVLESKWGDQHPLQMAQALAYVAELDRAFIWLEQAMPVATVTLQTSIAHPFYDPLRDDPRWMTIIEQIGRTQEQMDQVPFSLDAARARLGL